MNKVILLIIASMALASSIANSNPRPCYEIQEIQAIPPRIGLTICDSLDISGDTIYTASGYSLVNQGVIAPRTNYGELFYLDSTNTSGFAFNQESDSVIVGINDYINPVVWGMSGDAPPPITGNKIELKMYPLGHITYKFCFDFAEPRQSLTDVVLNEINPHNSWNLGTNFIELYNRGNSQVNLENWKLVCDTILTLPRGATIPSHKFYIINDVIFPSAWDMDSTGDNIYLIDSDNQVVDQVGWSSDHGPDISFMRFPDGAVDTTYPYYDFWGFDDESSSSFSDGFPTRGSYNSVDSPGLRVIGIRADSVDGGALIQWTNPVWLVVFSQVILRRSYETFPATPFDGDLIYEGTDQQYLDRDIIPDQMAYYTVFARTGCGDYSLPDSQSQVAIRLSSSGIGETPLPKKPAILTCYPNPFNGFVTFTLASNEDTRLAIYSIDGASVADIPITGGRAQWDARSYSSGIYFARALSNKQIAPIKLIYLK